MPNVSKIEVDEIGGATGTTLTLTTGHVITGSPGQFQISGGTAGQALITDGTGNLTFSDAGASVTIADNPPSSPSAGDLWWESDTGILKVYYNDGTTSQWVDATPQDAPTGIPSQSTHAGKYLKTDGTILSWETVITDPTMGGDLTGTASNAQIAADAVGSAEIANDAVGSSEIATGAIGLVELSATGTADATTFLRGDNTWAAAGGGGGITHVSSWDMTTDFASDLEPINANWVVFPSTYGYGSIGSAMTQSAGIFTFPVTGIWQIFFCANFKLDSNENRYVNAAIRTTTDNSTYNRATQQRGSMYGDAALFTYESVRTDFIFDVTDISTHKCYFGVQVEDNATITEGGGTGSDPHRTYATFIRLGDT